MTSPGKRLDGIAALVALGLIGCTGHAGSSTAPPRAAAPPAPSAPPAQSASPAPSAPPAPSASSAPSASPAPSAPADATVTVRYQVTDIDRSIAFYTETLDFRPAERSGSAFAAVRRGPLRLILSGPGSSGSRPMPDGRRQEPGGWNRISIDIDALAPLVERLRASGARFRNDIEVGPGGKQILLEDPSGNPIELHEPPVRDKP